MRWRLILEEFRSDQFYIKGSENIAADALSLLDKTDNPNDTNSNSNNKVELTLESLSKNFASNTKMFFTRLVSKLL